MEKECKRKNLELTREKLSIENAKKKEQENKEKIIKMRKEESE